MTPERWSRVAPIVHSALTRSTEVRAAFVADACGGDGELRREVESLLGRASDVEDFLNGAAVELLADPDWPGAVAGDRIGPCRIMGPLGAGGMGEVYRAHDGNLKRDVAIKILPQSLAADPGRVARLEREARMLAALNHPGIGAIYGLERIRGVPALILELVEGPTLAERLAGEPLSIAEAVSIAITITEALDAAHQRGIVHRDIKPTNIKITPSGAVKVLDFGLAKDIRRRDDETMAAAARFDRGLDLSSPGMVVGTVAYMSPEQARGDPIDERADLFSLGAVLFEMATGRRAFPGDDVSQIIDAIIHASPPSPRLINANVSQALERVIVRLLEPAPESRYQTASAVRADLVKVLAAIDTGRSPGSIRVGRPMMAMIALAAIVALGLWKGLPVSHNPSVRGEYEQVTYFADSATSPALSHDGRRLVFIRGSSTFEGPGQVYLKDLPDGEPLPLTADDLEKMSPVFSPDDSRIVYTAVSSGFAWDTWVVPLSNGTPRRWLANASGLTWFADRHQVLFSEMGPGLHMSLVTTDESRAATRVLYSPISEQGMAHRAYPSPNGQWVLVAEMVRPVWQQCRLVAADGRTSRPVGPEGQCTSAAWSPDGSWMYFSSNRSGGFHIWRARFPDGTPEQISFGPGEEEGVALAADGRSLLTSVGNRQSSILLHDRTGHERDISPDGYAFIPDIPNGGVTQPFSNAGKILYLVQRGPRRFTGPVGERAGELWETDLKTLRSGALFPGFRVTGYDVSRDGRQIVFAASDEGGASRIWIAGADRRDPPRLMSALAADNPRFGPNGSVYCRSLDGGTSFVYRLGAHGDAVKASDRPVDFLLSVSPDGAWLVVRTGTAPGAGPSQVDLAVPTTPSASPVRLCYASCEVDWTADGRSLVVRLADASSTSLSRTLVVRLRDGETLPRIPPAGIRSETDFPEVNVLKIDGAVYPDDGASVTASVRRATQRNIYRVPLS